MAQNSGKTYWISLAAAIIGGILTGSGLTFGILFTIVQLLSPENAHNVVGFIGAIAICPLPLIVAGSTLLVLGGPWRKQGTRADEIAQPVRKTQNDVAPNLSFVSEGQTLTIEYEGTVDSYIEFNLFHAEHSPNFKKQYQFMRVVLGVLFALMVPPFLLLFRAWVQDALFPLFIAIICITSVSFGIYVYYRYPQMRRIALIKSMRKSLEEGNTKTLYGKRTLTLSSGGIFIASGENETKLAWSSIDKVMENDRYIFMYTSAVNAIVIPKAAFTAGQQREFLDFIEAQREKYKETGVQ